MTDTYWLEPDDPHPFMGRRLTLTRTEGERTLTKGLTLPPSAAPGGLDDPTIATAKALLLTQLDHAWNA